MPPAKHDQGQPEKFFGIFVIAQTIAQRIFKKTQQSPLLGVGDDPKKDQGIMNPFLKNGETFAAPLRATLWIKQSIFSNPNQPR